MGSGCDTVKEALDYLNEKRDYNCGVISVKLYRPWSVKHFLEVLPKSV